MWETYWKLKYTALPYISFISTWEIYLIIERERDSSVEYYYCKRHRLLPIFFLYVFVFMEKEMFYSKMQMVA